MPLLNSQGKLQNVGLLDLKDSFDTVDPAKIELELL